MEKQFNILFNNTEYIISESDLAPAISQLQSHFSTVMNGTGATIKLGGTSYGIDSAKLSAATNEFITNLETISGDGMKVVIGGVEYGIDSTKVAGVIAELHEVLGGLQSGGSETVVNEIFNISWDGNKDGLVTAVVDQSFGVGFAKVSDTVIVNNEDVKNLIGKHSQMSEESVVVSDEDWDTLVSDGLVSDDYVFSNVIVCIRKDETKINLMGIELVFPEKGIYLFVSDNAHIEYVYSVEPIALIKP